MWPSRRPHLEFEEKDYEQMEDAEVKGVKRRKQVRCLANPFLDTEAGVDRDVSDDELSIEENSDYGLDGFIVADDVEY